ncbi:NUDIX domain-containing protein [Candidatus Dependentiae bacterium]|nr:NUDIX domain-containing protein [Candidatus Dependentiae bacterium]
MIDSVPSYLFTKNIRFVVKSVVWHPDKKINKFLVLRRSESEFIRPSTFDIPGGGIHFGELYQDGIKREVYEETGLKINNIQELILFTSYQPNENIYNIILGVSSWAVEDQIRLSPEHQKYRWMTFDEFLNYHPAYIFVHNRLFNIHSNDFICDIVTKAFSYKKMSELIDF